MADKAPASVLMTADTVGGVWTYSMELVRWLSARGTHTTLATMGPALTDAQWDEARAIPALTIEESSFQLEWMDEPWADVDCASEWLLNLNARVRPDIVHLSGYAHAALPWKAPVVCVAHSCVLSWWRAVKGEAAPAKYDEYSRRVRAGLLASDVVAAPSQAMLSCLAAEYGFPGGGCVVPNARCADLFRPAAKEPFILASGRIWDEAKNIAAVDGVAGELSWPVYIPGEDRHPNGSEAQLRTARALGRRPAAEMAGWFGRASVYVLPARYEPFGLSGLEAALSGCALVLADIPSLREVWGDAALYVHPGNRAELRDTLQRVIRSDSLRARRNFESRQRAAA
jgi:glycogen synthase